MPHVPATVMCFATLITIRSAPLIPNFGSSLVTGVSNIFHPIPCISQGKTEAYLQGYKHTWRVIECWIFLYRRRVFIASGVHHTNCCYKRFVYIRGKLATHHLRWCYTGRFAKPICNNTMFRENRSSVTPPCGRFFAIFAVLQRVASFWKRFKNLQQHCANLEQIGRQKPCSVSPETNRCEKNRPRKTCLPIRAKNMRCGSALQIGQCNAT